MAAGSAQQALPGAHILVLAFPPRFGYGLIEVLVIEAMTPRITFTSTLDEPQPTCGALSANVTASGVSPNSAACL